MAPEAPSNDRGGAGRAAGVPALVLPSFGIRLGGISCARPGWRGRCGDGEAESESAASGLGQAARRSALPGLGQAARRSRPARAALSV